ncbi:MAG: efflux RND transporter periplasmic adaptor subunit [Gammaproteobacteria bacterium]|jgi:RND family efflux transporter MFP subunit|nr:efflux RND transporter periplasmic adaptor subunit [Gammaproteobacteria bacterium]MDH5171578.1 efflux RND transporter periplasmic adaptor subunit [Gammaproteobacteria bacterium]
MNKKLLYPILILVLGVGLAALIALNPAETVPDDYAPLVATVRVIKVEPKAEYLTVTSQGTVEPRSQSELIPEVSGRAVWISPSLVGGGSFARDDVLLRIDDADYRSSLTRAEAALKRAEVEQDYARDELQRAQSLRDKNLASQQQLDNVRRASWVTEANFNESQAAVDQARRDLARTELKAPFDGLVRNEQVDLGQFVTRGQSIGTIYATDYVEVRLPIAADQLVYLGLPLSTRGQIPENLRPPVTVAADFGNARLLWEGELIRAEAEFDARTRMLNGVARLRTDGNGADALPLPVGMFVQAQIRGRKAENIIRLPRSAMRDNNQVMVIDADQRLHFRQVSILRLEHDDMLVDGGLEAGELVCVSPLQTVVEGMRVNPVLEQDGAP